MDLTGRKGTPLTDEGYASALALLGCEPAALWAVISVETSGIGFDQFRRPRILFERHIFHRLTKGKFAQFPSISQATPGGYTTQEYTRLELANRCDEDAALKSASWGLGQIMGFNHTRAGFATVNEMVEAMFESEDNHLMAMAKFIKAAGLDDELRRQDWLGFAYGYNGPAQRGYDEKLRKAYAKISKNGMPDLSVRSIQISSGYVP